MLPDGLDPGLLLRILERVQQGDNELPGRVPKRESSDTLQDLVLAEGLSPEEARGYLNRHLRFLKERGFIDGGGPAIATGDFSNLWIMPEGQMFVQPELAGFAGNFWPQVVNVIEQHVHEAPVQDSLKENWRYRLSEAAVRQAVTELFALLREMVRAGAF